MPKGYVPKGGHNLFDVTDRISDLYRSAADSYNSAVRSVQGYFSGRNMESEQDFEIYSFLDQMGVPRNQIDELYAYMDRNGLTWSDLNTTKTLRAFSGNGIKTYQFVSKNVNRLYR